MSNKVNVSGLEPLTSGLVSSALNQLSYTSHYAFHVDAILVYTIANSS